MDPRSVDILFSFGLSNTLGNLEFYFLELPWVRFGFLNFGQIVFYFGLDVLESFFFLIVKFGALTCICDNFVNLIFIDTLKTSLVHAQVK